MSAGVLTSLSDVGYRLGAAADWAAAAGAALWLVLSYNCSGYVNMNYHYAHAVQQSSMSTDRSARTMRVLAISCMFVAY